MDTRRQYRWARWTKPPPNLTQRPARLSTVRPVPELIVDGKRISDDRLDAVELQKHDAQPVCLDDVGTHERLGVPSLGLLGIASNEALAFAILLHACWYVPTMLAGGVALGMRALLRARRAQSARAASGAVE